MPKQRLTKPNLPVFGSYQSSCGPLDRSIGHLDANGLLEPVLQYSGCLAGARLTALNQKLPFESNHGL